jgi:ubiquinone/menaquinone biosynthesis C-methylase UbiE
MSVILTESTSNITQEDISNNRIQHLLQYTNSSKIYRSLIQTLRRGFNNSKKHNILFTTMLRRINNLLGNDTVIYVYIHNFLNEFIYPISGTPNNESASRANKRVATIKELLSIVNIEALDTYVDIGCSAGGITWRVGTSLGVSANNTYGVDVIESSKVGNTGKFNYIQLANMQQSLPFNSGSVQLITMLMSLHHIREPIAYLKESYRALSPGGILIVREHDCDSIADPEMGLLLDVLHGLYCISWNKTGSLEDVHFSHTHYAQYKSRDTWTKLITDIGFVHSTSDPYISKLYNMSQIPRKYAHRHYIPNVYLSYWAVYIKPL